MHADRTDCTCLDCVARRLEAEERAIINQRAARANRIISRVLWKRQSSPTLLK